MAFNISSFNSNIGVYGVVPNNKFFVVITPPMELMGTLQEAAMLRGEGVDTIGLARLMQFRAEQARLPGLLLQTNDVRRYGLGVVEKMPFNVQFTDTSFTFIGDKNGSIYRYMYLWLTSIVDFSGTRVNAGTPIFTTEYKDNYTADIDIFVFDNEGFLSKQVTLMDAYPNSLNDISLDWSNNNSVMKITAGFTFRTWKVNEADIVGGGGFVTLDSLVRAFSSPTTAAYVAGESIINWLVH